jgi:hypothetical protein
VRASVISAALVATSLCAGGAAWLRWQRALPGSVPDRLSIAAPRVHPPAATDSALADAEELTVSNDPFRLANSPSSVRFDPAADAIGVVSASTIPQPRPVLVLKAIVGGPPWQAVIDGIPGQPPGTFAKQGTRFDKLTIRAVTRDSVIVQGTDTAWVLSFRGR